MRHYYVYENGYVIGYYENNVFIPFSVPIRKDLIKELNRLEA